MWATRRRTWVVRSAVWVVRSVMRWSRRQQHSNRRVAVSMVERIWDLAVWISFSTCASRQGEERGAAVRPRVRGRVYHGGEWRRTSI
jgi:hypothetical protein